MTNDGCVLSEMLPLPLLLMLLPMLVPTSTSTASRRHLVIALNYV